MALPKHAHLASYLENSVRRFPDRTAVVGPDGRSLTYQELNDRANRVAQFLSLRGIRPGARVGLILPKSVDAVAIMFGILKARAAYVPADWKAPLDRSYTILSDCHAQALFVDTRLLDSLLTVSGGSLPATVVAVSSDPNQSVQTAPFVDWEEVLQHDSASEEATGRTPADLAYILYTSGSTGKPKGVMLTHENACAFVDWCSNTFLPTPEDRFSNHAPFHFDLSVLDLYVPLKHGASTHLIGDDLSQNPRLLAQFIAERKISIWYSAPSILTMMAQFGKLDVSDARSLRIVLFAGEVFPAKHLRLLTTYWPHPTYYNLYGPTETNVCTFAKIPLPIPADRLEPYPIGPACAHCDAMVLDENENIVSYGDEGLLYIAGPSVFSGYWNRPEENASRFVERAGRRWYNTGDVVRKDREEGYIYLGRRDRMVKRRGYRIELGEIETALYRHEKLKEVGAIARSEQDGVKIFAYVATPPSERLSIIDLKTFSARVLPSYMIPDTFIVLDQLPRTSTDKIDYQALVRSSSQSVVAPQGVSR